jgi:GATA-binding protein
MDKKHLVGPLKEIAQSSSPPSNIASHLLADSLFPPRKPKKAVGDEMDESDPDENEGSDSDDSTSGKKKDPLATQVWRMYTKAKDTLPNGSRLENLTWRMMAMTLNKKKAEAERVAREGSAGRSPASTPVDAPESPAAAATEMDEDRPTDMIDRSNTPPAPDDTTTLLSSSAPPYGFDFLKHGPNSQSQQQQPPSSPKERQTSFSKGVNLRKNVMISGSARASSSLMRKPSNPNDLQLVKCIAQLLELPRDTCWN